MFGLDIVTFLLVVILILGVSGVAGMANWLLNHLILVFFLLMVKSVLTMGSGFFKENDHPSYYITQALIVLADVIRNGVFLYFASLLLSELFAGTLLDFIFQIFTLIIGGPLLLLASEGPMYLVYDLMDSPGPVKKDEAPDMSCFWFCVGMEAAAIVAMLLVYFIFL